MSKLRKAPNEGILFPRDSKTSDSEVSRSSTFGNKSAWAAAAFVADKSASEKIMREKRWRQTYQNYVIEHVKLSLRSPETAIAMANAGLDYCYNNFEFLRDGKLQSFNDAMKTYTTNPFKTGFIQGTGAKPTREVSVPYKNKKLSNAQLINQLRLWAEKGTIEPSAREAIELVVKNQDQWLDLSDKYFVLLGAGSAMGPFPILMQLGANVIAIDLDRKGVWDRLIEVARRSPGTLTFPLKIDQKGLDDGALAENAGANLFTQTPEIRNWLLEVHPGKDLVVGSYAYLDGELHVKVSLAMDSIVRDLTTKRKESTFAACAYLCTPTDDHVIPAVAAASQKENLKNLAFPIWLLSAFMTPSTLSPIVPQSNGPPINIVDAIVPQQGPNYALAKRMQHWRSIIARFSTEVTVSTNVAPATATVSVTKNAMFQLAYEGFKFFNPLEVFESETSNALMATLLIHDLRNERSVKNPKSGIEVQNPLMLFTSGAVHGGRIPSIIMQTGSVHVGQPSDLVPQNLRPTLPPTYSESIFRTHLTEGSRCESSNISISGSFASTRLKNHENEQLTEDSAIYPNARSYADNLYLFNSDLQPMNNERKRAHTSELFKRDCPCEHLRIKSQPTPTNQLGNSDLKLKTLVLNPFNNEAVFAPEIIPRFSSKTDLKAESTEPSAPTFDEIMQKEQIIISPVPAFEKQMSVSMIPFTQIPGKPSMSAICLVRGELETKHEINNKWKKLDVKFDFDGIVRMFEIFDSVFQKAKAKFIGTPSNQNRREGEWIWKNKCICDTVGAWISVAVNE
ncbi:Very-long-chain (3R)-3-hydroxyacyl-CoA dehydratase PASTICCINO 2 [Nowakowskiella sp. JEL0078]|nr:Very-long-chain (3R)-3-hydroxyacyl-CoA dehydratase PASTICCINO 2 [Nowakowskiella sp. JEL0078]